MRVRPYERRRFNRVDMATRDCRLTLMWDREGRRERQVCTLVDLSYAGLRFHAHRSVAVGELVEFLIDIRSPVQRSGFTRACVRWARPLGFQEYDAGAEFSEQSKGLLLGPEERCP
jgi:PilZ domain-containing protein